ncbi:hypothetical protein [Yersinia pseudotuberculosis]|uniref:hypothetical protein n=1 Tax=Yersinia pseudotuberculosis TaxID=633 RepID=UPI0005AD4C10|nr:hypothetical protein [Yersinia pseudotuberculosis]AJJ72731.1 hypothetical protein BZ23_671 [Yersinia pseudotuberculosis]CNK15753.1 Uncharacterised protein [Yersinia pseudotuberculosis]
MNNIEELKKAALAVLELTDVKGCWQSSLLETKDRGAVHAIVTEHGDNICEATGDTVIDSVIIDYIESASPAAMLDLIAQLEAAQKELFDLHNQEFQQRLANAEHQLYMKDLAIHNIKASRMAQFRKRLAAEYALSAANEKLSKPVVLPDDGLDDCINIWPDNWRNDFDTGYNFGVWRCEQNIKAAGFAVEGE